jgi:eukaryotic-like serine/threonine-protein kinase
VQLATAPKLGQSLGRYRVLEQIGAGAMGVVYRAHDGRLDRDVALKVLPPGTLSNESARKRIRKEALALSRLNHPNIATVFDFDIADGIDFLVMELLQGTSLAGALAAGPLPQKQIVRLGADLAQGLAAAHQQGVIHCDLKPGNLFITSDGRLKILDFGLANYVTPAAQGEDTLTLTKTQTTAGTLPYMAPEQLRGETADERTDLWAAGAVLYEMATGQRPFNEPVATRVIASILDRAPVPLRILKPTLEPELERIILKCLEKEPEMRYQSARELEIDLRRLTGGSTGSSPSLEMPTRRSRQPLLTALIVVVTVAAASLVILGARHRIFTGAAGGEIHSLAVLPLENMSRDPEQEYFTDSMTDAIITDLAKIKALRVVSRTSVLRYKHTNKSIPEIAKELNVDALVEGSVERAGNRVRITAQLIRAGNDQHLWADAYDRELRDVLRLQDEVARSIAREVRVNLTPEERARLTTARQVDPEAYQLYLKGRYFWVKRTAESIGRAIDYFRQAIDKDPGYATAYAGLADCYSSMGFSWDLGSMAPSEVQPKAIAAATKAIELDNSSGEAHSSLAFIKLNYDWDWPGAEAEFRRGIELNPGWANVHHWYAHMLLSAGRIEEAEQSSKKALELDALSPIMNVHLVWHYYYGRQYDKALEQVKKTLELDSNYGLAYWYRGLVYEAQGKYDDAVRDMRRGKELLKGNIIVNSDLAHAYAVSGKKPEAEKALAELRQVSEKRYVNPFEIALIYMGLGNKDDAFDWLEKAYRQRSDLLVYLKVDPRLDPIRSDPRFVDLMRRVGIP